MRSNCKQWQETAASVVLSEVQLCRMIDASSLFFVNYVIWNICGWFAPCVCSLTFSQWPWLHISSCLVQACPRGVLKVSEGLCQCLQVLLALQGVIKTSLETQIITTPGNFCMKLYMHIIVFLEDQKSSGKTKLDWGSSFIHCANRFIQTQYLHMRFELLYSIAGLIY